MYRKGKQSCRVLTWLSVQSTELFGFRNYGVLLGLINVVVSGVSLVQGLLVAWGESQSSYLGPNLVLLVATFPLFFIVLWTTGPSPRASDIHGAKKTKRLMEQQDNEAQIPTETTTLTERPNGHTRTNSGTFYLS